MTPVTFPRSIRRLTPKLQIPVYLIGVFLISLIIYATFSFVTTRLHLTTITRQALVSDFRTFNPLFTQPYSFEHAWADLLYRGLTKYADDGQITGDLAVSWEIRKSGEEFLVHLDPQAMWSDNTPITADDVAFTYGLTQQETYSAWAADFFSGVTIEVVDQKTLLFLLPTPYMSFLDTLTLPIIPKHILTTNNPASLQNVSLMDNAVYSGPYKLAERKTALLSNNAPYTNYIFEPFASELETISISTFNTNQDMLSAFELGKIDEMIFPEHTYQEFEEQLADLATQTYAQKGMYYALIINTKDVGDVNFRRSIAKGIDKTKLIGQQAKGPIPENTAFYASLDEFRETFKPEEAEPSLAGKEMTIATLDLSPFTFLGEQLVSQLGSLGMAVNIQAVDPKTFYETLIPEKKYKYLLVSQHVGRDPDLYSFWHSSQTTGTGLNFANLVNRRVDKALEEARRQDNFEERKSTYSEFQQFVLEESPAIFLVHPKTVLVSRNQGTDDSGETNLIWELEDLWQE